MAFSKDNTQSTSSTRTPAPAWVNVSIPLTKGTDGKDRTQQLAGIPLDPEDPVHAMLIARIQTEGAEKFTEALAKNIIVSINVPGSNGEKELSF